MLLGCIAITSSTKPELLTNYETLAVFGLSESQEVYFIAEYMALSPRQSFIERRRIAELIGEQDLLPDRLNATTRAKIKEIFGVDALVMAQISMRNYAKSILSIRIVDSETGNIIAACSAIYAVELTPTDLVIKRAVQALIK